MKKHGKRSTCIILASALCLFAVSGAGAGDGILARIHGNGSSGIPEAIRGSGPSAAVYEDGSLPGQADERAGENGSTQAGNAGNSGVNAVPAEVLRCRYYNEKDFMNSVAAAGPRDGDKAGDAPGSPEASSSGIAGGIVPHHLLAGKMIAEFFQYLSQDPPQTVVVIAPNHRKIGMSGIHTSSLDWETPFGVLEAETGLTALIKEKTEAAENKALMEEEHSISSLAPYIKYYLPEAKIVPILLHGNYPSSEKLGNLLAAVQSEKPGTAIIASVDFSHYLDVETANKMDKNTLEAIRTADTEAISKMGNDNLDSPVSVITLITAMNSEAPSPDRSGPDLHASGDTGKQTAPMKTSDTRPPEVLAHLNSSDITGTGAGYTTGYYTIVYRR